MHLHLPYECGAGVQAKRLFLPDGAEVFDTALLVTPTSAPGLRTDELPYAVVCARVRPCVRACVCGSCLSLSRLVLFAGLFFLGCVRFASACLSGLPSHSPACGRACVWVCARVQACVHDVSFHVHTHVSFAQWRRRASTPMHCVASCILHVVTLQLNNDVVYVSSGEDFHPTDVRILTFAQRLRLRRRPNRPCWEPPDRTAPVVRLRSSHAA